MLLTLSYCNDCLLHGGNCGDVSEFLKEVAS